MATKNWNLVIWRLAGPIMISNVSVPLLGIVDTAVVGQLDGAHYIGGVAIGAQIFSIMYWTFGFLRMGTTGFTAQSLGRGDMDQVLAWLMRSFVIAIIAGVGLVILQVPLLSGALSLIGPSQQVSQLTSDYYAIRIWGAPAVLMSYGLLGWFIGIQNTKALLMIQVGMNVSNIILDLIFVLGFGWGVEGVALATVISETGAAIFGCWLAIRHARGLGGQWRLSLLTQWDHLKKLMSLNRDIIIRTLCLEAAFVTITALGARMGDTILAVNAVLMLFQGLMAYGLDGFAHAVETLAGHARGARDKTAFKAAVRTSTIWALAFSVPFSLVFWLFGGELIDLMSKTAEVRLIARDYLIWIIILPILSVWSFQLDGIFFGLTRGTEMRNAMIVSLAVFAAAISLLVEPYGNHGLWLAFSIFMATRGITLGFYYPAIERSMDKIL